MSITVDNDHSGLVIIGSGAGGTEIEEMSEDKSRINNQRNFAVENGFRSLMDVILLRK